MAGYGWEEYDIRHGGRQTILDAENNVDITIDFVKTTGSQGTEKDNWAARIKGTPRADAPPKLKTTLIFYAASEGLGNLGFSNRHDDRGHSGDVVLTGQTSELGQFRLEVRTGPKSNKYPKNAHPSYKSKPLDRTRAASLQVPAESLWQGKNLVLVNIKQEFDKYVSEYGQENLPPPEQILSIPNDIKDGNFHIIQKTFEGAFEFEIVFTAGSGESISAEQLSKAISDTSNHFKSKFAKIFSPKAPFTDAKYTKFSQAMLSNLVGGIGYFSGTSLVDRSYAPEYEEENEGFWDETADARGRAQVTTEPATQLFTSVPSRPFFPRGFLWDEGFHLIPIADWDMDLTLEIVQSWFNLMDDDGWIAREQILGPEARSKVPEEFQIQYPHYANPPSLFLILDLFVDKLSSETYDAAHATALKEHIHKFYPLLKRQHAWFRKTQFGEIKAYDRVAFNSREAYRWRGRTPRHILPSGLDDYPRPQPPHPGELHTDLMSWMGLVVRSLRRIAEELDEGEDANYYLRQEAAIYNNVYDLHWSEKNKAYCDATIDEYEESVHVCHKGYVSLFPFMTGLVGPNNPRLKHVLDLIADPAELWTDFGIRSLSKADELYGTDENYWRGPIWINMNYLIIKNLLVYLSPPKPSPEENC